MQSVGAGGSSQSSQGLPPLGNGVQKHDWRHSPRCTYNAFASLAEEESTHITRRLPFVTMYRFVSPLFSLPPPKTHPPVPRFTLHTSSAVVMWSSCTVLSSPQRGQPIHINLHPPTGNLILKQECASLNHRSDLVTTRGKRLRARWKVARHVFHVQLF